SGAGEEPEQVEGALEGGARVCGDEAEVRICEATLSRTEEECHPTVRGVRAGESVLGAEKTVALGTGLARERRLLITGEPPKQAEDRERPNPNACTGLAEHLLPRRHELIQSFLSVSDLFHPKGIQGIEVSGNDIFFDTFKLLPPPHIHGQMTKVRVVTSEISRWFTSAWPTFSRHSGFYREVTRY